MIKQVWKYSISIGTNKLMMPEDAQILTIQTQHGENQLWALVNPNLPSIERTIKVVGTGWDISDNTKGGLKYIGTFQLQDGCG